MPSVHLGWGGCCSCPATGPGPRGGAGAARVPPLELARGVWVGAARVPPLVLARGVWVGAARVLPLVLARGVGRVLLVSRHWSWPEGWGGCCSCPATGAGPRGVGHPGPYGRGKCKFERRGGSSDEEYFKQQRGSAHVEEKLRSFRRDSKVSDLVRAVWSDSISVDTDETQVRQSRSLNLKKSSGYSRENASTRARSESPAVQFSRHRARNVSPSREAGPARPEKPDIRDLRKSRALVREVDKALDDLLDPDTSRGKQPRSKRYEDRGSVSSLSQSDSTESDFMRKLRRRQRRRGSRGKSCKMKGVRVSSKLFISRRRCDSYDSGTSGMSDDSRSRSTKRRRRRAVPQLQLEKKGDGERLFLPETPGFLKIKV
uniref:Uncharacterized protein n=1 Tax=Branchiostoma floridae TaxID=7739 RepID=C4A057_BRAFL|eukprot:XP_002585814.1 hypothetical protein BRAFLDRAFT_111069 [Branchiostoma floridae]